MENPIDPDYKASSLMSKDEPKNIKVLIKIMVVILCIIFGYLLVQEAYNLNLLSSAFYKTGIISDLTVASEGIHSLQGEVDNTKSSIEDVNKELSKYENLRKRIDSTKVVNGFTSETKSGIAITIGDGLLDNAKVSDLMLQGIANELFNLGADAVSINGLRLTNQASIRTAGEAITVNYEDISSPYLILASGNKNDLYNGFLASSVRGSLASLEGAGASFSIEQADDMTINGASTRALEFAKVE
jgi:uncharacterized protein YlxW (UPF0749 family)